MKKLNFSILFLVLSLIISIPGSALADDLGFGYAKQLGGTGGDQGNSVVVDSLGNVYTTGYFSGTADFDPGAGTTNLVSAGGADIFVSKLDSSGNFVWAKRLGGTNFNDQGLSISVDSLGNVYTVGVLLDTADFDPGAGNFDLTSVGGEDIFISKLDSSGNFVWAKQFGGAGNERALGVKVDSSGNVYTTGYFNGTVDFDPDGVDVVNLVSAGGQDIFISKLDVNGDFAWVKQFGGAGGDASYSITLDSSNNVYTTGYFSGTVDFDPGAGTSNLVGLSSDSGFVSKLDSSGNFVWAEQFSGAGGFVAPYSIAVDTSGNVYTTGYLDGTSDFDPGAGTQNLSIIGSYDMYVSKLSSSGAFVWVKQIAGAGAFVYPYSMAVDTTGDVYVAGYFEETVDFDPGAGTANLTFVGYDEAFVLKLDSTGNFVYGKQLSGLTGGDGTYAYGVAIDSSNNVYTIGYFSAAADFDPGAGTQNLSSFASSGDIFISQLLSLDTTDPTILSLSPIDGATGVAVDVNLVITFDEAVDVGTGNIVIYKVSDDSVFETIDVTSLNVTGTGTDTITINPTGTLASLTDYYVQIDATALDDLAGNSYAGIADETTWNFTAVEVIVPSSGGSSGSRPSNQVTSPVLCPFGNVYNTFSGKKCTTWSPATPPFNTPPAYAFGTTLVKLGSTGEACKAWQSFFNAHGSSLVLDGKCGPLTMTAAKAWQASVGLTADGLLGPLSRGKAWGM